MNINEKFYFNPKEKLTVQVSNSALRRHTDQFEICSKLKGNFPIILDTNILLGYYGMSQQEKKKLIEFLDKFKKRIILTKQVEEEFLRNRLTVIKENLFCPLHIISEDYTRMKKNIEGSLRAFRKRKKKILSQDYPDLFIKLQVIEEEVKTAVNNDKFAEEIKSRVEETTTDYKNIALIDDLLDKISKFKITEELNSDEVEFLENKFLEHLNDYKNEKEISRWKLAIPGCGETKEDATGDYLIYHEALKYMLENKTSVIFLTNDVTKVNGLQIDRNPNTHFIAHTYRLTENILYIIHAEKTLPKISFENIYQIRTSIITNNDIPISLESTIISIDIEKGFGFIYTKDKNLFFCYTDYDGNFRELEKNNVVTYDISTNFNGEPKAINVKKIIYDFDSSEIELHQSEISHINKYRGIGFIFYQPENLYFHQAFLDEDVDFGKFEIGTPVDYLIGTNDEGEKIARKVRII